MSVMHTPTIRVIGQTLHFRNMPVTTIYLRPNEKLKSLIFGSNINHNDDLLLVQSEVQRSRYR